MSVSSSQAGIALGSVVLDDVTKRFGSVTAVSRISLTVQPASILGVIGPSGAGKTTTIRMLTGALAPTSGTVRVLGEDPMRFKRRSREKIGYMPQQFSHYPDLTAAENLDFVASLFGMLWLKRRRRVNEMLRLVDLWDARKRRAADLSGGMQRRLELACTLVHDPTVLFLDEPTAGIDPILRRTIWDEMHRLKDDGRTLLMTTQYVNEAEECDTVALVADGTIIALGTPDELRREAAGGDLIEVETAHAFDAERLLRHTDVRSVEQRGPRAFVVVVDHAEETMPTIGDRVREEGGEFETAREFRMNFDDVFTRLVGKQTEEAAESSATDASAEPSGKDRARPDR
jgi:ABC-2 type transport system ATP-binding protein